MEKLKNNLWNRLFHNKKLKAQLKEEERIARLHRASQRFLARLKVCDSFKDLVSLHKEIVEFGYEFDTSHSWNFGELPVEQISVKCLSFYAYDRDTCIYGKDILEAEQDPEKYLDDDWMMWSYWTSWCWYYKTLYKRIKYPEDPLIHLENPIEVPVPYTVKDFFN